MYGLRLFRSLEYSVLHTQEDMSVKDKDNNRNKIFLE